MRKCVCYNIKRKTGMQNGRWKRNKFSSLLKNDGQSMTTLFKKCTQKTRQKYIKNGNAIFEERE